MKERRGSRNPVRDFPGIHLVTHVRQSNNAPISQEPATELQLNSTASVDHTLYTNSSGSQESLDWNSKNAKNPVPVSRVIQIALQAA